MDFQSLRKEYERNGLSREELHGNPIENLRQWMALAVKHCPGRWFEPNAMALGTADTFGNVATRIVLLKDIVDDGIIFYTNYDSTKGRQIESNPQVACAIHWPYLGRQIRFKGPVEKTSREIAEAYFHSRPRGSQISAFVSPQSNEIESHEMLEAAAKNMERDFAGQEIPLPENWGGYLVTPIEFEFWQGRLDRLHDRFQFRRDNVDETSWRIVRLAP